MSLVEQVTEQVRSEIEQGIINAKEAGRFSYEEMPAFIVEVPKDKSHGDFATNAAMLLTKQAKMKPRDIAQAIVDSLNKDSKLIDKVEIAGPGFINFYLSQNWVYDILPTVEEQDEKFGFVDVGHGEKVQVEFVSANPTGLLHMGNARGGALGDSLANLLKMAGYDVTKEFYINDAGNQIVNLGLSLEARYRQELGDVDYPFPEKGYHGKDIIDTAKRIIAEVGDSYLALPEEERQQKMIATALDEKISAIKSGLKDFGVEYDVWFSETSLHESGAVKEVVDLLTEKGLTYEKEGAIWLKTTEFGEEKDEVLVRSNGIPTYFAADIAYHKNKYDRGFKRVINIWGADHHGHVARMKRSMDAIGYNGDDLTILLMQLVRLYQNGEVVRMSKRTGQYVTLQELIEDVGKDAARYFFIMRNPDSHLDFDLDLAKQQSSDNPVYYVQYAHARINSILTATGKAAPKAADCDLTLLTEESELELIRKIANLPTEIAYAAQELEPYRMARYATDLATLFHSFYNSCRVLTDDEALRDARLVLVNATRITLRNVLTLLGVSAPERM
ncbi:MAG: arginine--tRNA ligase [Peptococcaceae bacterium]|jgi:arginyl-tRNA synthetase|nr:arginine--tRNA ligase [Peptococcaceae bacterium]